MEQQSFFEQSFRRLEDAVASGFKDLQTQFRLLPETYIGRKEFERYRDEAKYETAATEKRHEDEFDEIKGELKGLRDDIARREEKEQAEKAARDEQLRQDKLKHKESVRQIKMWRLGFVATVVLGLPGSVYAFISLLQNITGHH